MQSEPVSPPPRITTCLPGREDRLVRRHDRRPRRAGSAGAGSPSRSGRRRARGPARRGRAAPRRRCRAGSRRSPCAAPSTDRSTPTCTPVWKRDALLAQLLEPAIDHPLLELEVGDPVAEQSADPVVLLEERDGVARAVQLLRRGEARRAGADDRHRAAGAALGPHRRAPSPRPSRAARSPTRSA